MLTVLGITGPIFILIGIGFAAVRCGALVKTEIRSLGVFVINFALPALLFKAMAERSLGDLLNLRLLTIYTLGSLAVIVGGIAFFCLIQKRSIQSAAVSAMGISLSNSAFIGLPIASQLIGSAATSNLAVYAVVENLILIPLLMIFAEFGGHTDRHWTLILRDIFLRLLRSPMLMSILIGVGFSALELQLPLAISRVVDLMSGASSPVALFYVGCILARINLKGMGADIGSIVIGKLIFHPLAVFGIFILIPFDSPTLRTAAIINASMPMMSIYPLLGQKYEREGICAAALVAATVMSFFTISLLLFLTDSGR